MVAGSNPPAASYFWLVGVRNVVMVLETGYR